MKKLILAFCFLDEDDNIFAKKDLNISWNYPGKEDETELRDIIAMDEAASIIDGQVKMNIDEGVIREMLHEMKGTS
jgi:hypothetical protein